MVHMQTIGQLQEANQSPKQEMEEKGKAIAGEQESSEQAVKAYPTDTSKRRRSMPDSDAIEAGQLWIDSQCSNHFYNACRRVPHAILQDLQQIVRSEVVIKTLLWLTKSSVMLQGQLQK